MGIMYLDNYTLLLLDIKKLLKRWSKQSDVLTYRDKLLLKQAIDFLVLVQSGDMIMSRKTLLPAGNQLVANTSIEEALGFKGGPFQNSPTSFGRKNIDTTIDFLHKLENGTTITSALQKNYDEVFSLFSSLVRQSVIMIDTEIA
jgi:hypothetical protein